MFKPKETFINMFYALDAAYDENPEIGLGSFLSVANPLLFKDGNSADSAIYAEFETKFFKELGNSADTTATYRFVVNFLEQQTPPLANYFCNTVNAQEWKQSFSDIN